MGVNGVTAVVQRHSGTTVATKVGLSTGRAVCGDQRGAGAAPEIQRYNGMTGAEHVYRAK